MALDRRVAVDDPQAVLPGTGVQAGAGPAARARRDQDERLDRVPTQRGTLVGLPFSGESLLRPLATDLSTGQLVQLGWVKFRSSGSKTLYCRLGGDPSSATGQSVILPSEDNRNVLAMWQGSSAPQPPVTTFGPGCRRGHPLG